MFALLDMSHLDMRVRVKVKVRVRVRVGVRVSVTMLKDFAPSNAIPMLVTADTSQLDMSWVRG